MAPFAADVRGNSEFLRKDSFRFNAPSGLRCASRRPMPQGPGPGPQFHLENHMTLKTVLDHSATCTLFCTIGLMAIGATLPFSAAADPTSSRRTPETTTKMISLSGLTLATPQGQREPRLRLAKAAEHLCRTLGDERTCAACAPYSDCTRDAPP